MIDLTYLNEISGGDRTFVKEMLDLYINTTATEAAHFDALLANKDFKGIGHLAHKMKAPVQMLGDTELFETIRKVELLGKEATDTEQLPALIKKLMEGVSYSTKEVIELLKEY